MEAERIKVSEPGGRTYSVRAFVKRVFLTLTALVAVTSAIVFLLVYLPLKTELENSLIDNFFQLSFIRYASLQSSIDRGLEGARSLSSRSVIRNAILEYERGQINIATLMATTQLRYEEGAKALEYLIRAERFVGDVKIAGYISENFKPHSCTADERLTMGDEPSCALCLTDDHSYFAMIFPLHSEGRIIGYDKLVFDLSDQIRRLCTENIHSELFYHEDFENFTSDASTVQSGEVSSLFYKEGFYYQSFNMQGSANFVSMQSSLSLLDPVNRLSRQTFQAGMVVLLCFSTAIYFLVIRFAEKELVFLEDSRRSLTEAVSEANIDPLTEAGGRRFGEKFLAAAFEDFRRGGKSPAILMFDIDSLKHINDTYGHSAGDRVIRSVAKAVQQNIRAADMLLRWGGDEFIGIFSELGRENALLFAQKLLRAVSDLTIETETKAINPTISIGISYFSQEDRSFFEAINRADRAMYQSKSEGRNQAHER